MYLCTKQKHNRSTDTENDLAVTKGARVGGGIISSLGLKYIHYYK